MKEARHIWIFNPFDNLPEEGVRRQRYPLIANALQKAGYHVTWWSSNFRHATKTFRSAPAQYENNDAVRVMLLPTLPYKKNISLQRIRSHRKLAKTWLATALLAIANGELPAPDVIISSFPPISTGLTAARIGKLFSAPLIIDIQDLWPETFYQALPAFCRKLHLLFPIERLVKKLLRTADAVTTVSESYRRWALAHGAPCASALRIGIELENKNFPAKTDYSSPRLLYLGNMGKSYDLATVIAACIKTGWELQLAGTGPQEAELRQLAGLHRNINFHGFISAAEIDRLCEQCNLAVIPMFDASGVAIPNKLADYAAHALPTVNSLSGETRQLLEDYGAGAFYRAGDVESFIEAVKTIRPEHSAAALKLAKEIFDADSIYGHFVELIDALPQIETPPRKGTKIKRAFDLALVLCSAPLWLPLLGIISLLTLLIQGRPVFFTQSRPGFKCKIFRIIKFRTMRPDGQNDAERITAWGNFLRKTSLDELPELINVLRGEMSLVGPRPLLVSYLERYNEEQLQRQDTLPGITGWAQINGRNAISWEEKFAHDVWYVRNRSLKLDLTILAKTFLAVLLQRGISHGEEATMPEFKNEEQKS